MKTIPIDRHPWDTKYERVYTMTPSSFWLEVVEYRNWCETNPILTTKVVKDDQSRPMLFDVPKPRAMSTMGFCVFAVITQGDWEILRSRPEIAPLADIAETLFRSQVFEGAAVDLFNPAFISKFLGFAERKVLEGPDGQPLFKGELSEEELKKKAAERGIPTDIFD